MNDSGDPASGGALPLVSCIMPTHGRRRFVPLAVHYFLRQDYPHRELIVLDDGPDPVADLIPDDPRVRYVRLDRRLSVGAKRNLAIAEARGELIAHWDDDDWHGPNRLSRQVECLRGEVDLCGLADTLFYDPGAGKAWRYRYAGRRPWVAGGTMCYRRSVWADRPFAEVDDGEDTRFVWRLAPDKVTALADSSWFVGLVHPACSSRKQIRPPRWRARPLDEVRALLGADMGYYDGSASPPPPYQKAVDTPMVTVSIPTFGPPTHLRRAVESILGQTYPHLRVVVVNDGGDPPWEALADLDDPRLVRFDLDSNRGRYFADAVVLAATPDDYFLVQDADDWSEPERVERLLDRLRAEDADVAYSASYKCLAAAPEERWVERFPDLMTPIGEAFIHRANYHAALYRVDALRRIGGTFGGLRIGYDSLLVNLLRMTAHVVLDDRLLTTYCMRPDSLTGSSETGFGSPARDAAWERLNDRYQEARKLWERHRAGNLRLETLAELIRQRCTGMCSPGDRRALAREAARLGHLLGGDGDAETPAAPAPEVPELETILEDPRLPWSEWSVSKELARALADHLAQNRPGRALEVGSGISTLVMARHAAIHRASVAALEHDPVHFERTRDLLAAHGLEGHVDLRYGPVRASPSGGSWYDARLDGPYQFVFVDGPPLRIGRTAVLPAIEDALDERWTLWLKDGHRAHERACVETWARSISFRRRLWDVDPRGVWVLTGGEPAVTVNGDAGLLVSCLMPTYHRPQFVAQAAEYFLRQDYPHRELVVVDDGEAPVRDLVPEDNRIVYVRLESRASTGAKRNLAGEAARGDVLICWDDDDWYGPQRISAQVEPILRGDADVTGIGRSPLYCIPTSQFWRCTPRVHARMFYKQVVGGTLAFRRSHWRAGARFPDSSLAEDAALLRALLRRGARLAPVPNPDLFVYVRHDANSWRFVEGQYLDRRGWQAIAAPAFIPTGDLAFYGRIREATYQPAST